MLCVGETYNGHLTKTDTFMNLLLNSVIRTSPGGDRFEKLDQVYIKGACVKYLRVSQECLAKVKEDRKESRQRMRMGGHKRGNNKE